MNKLINFTDNTEVTALEIGNKAYNLLCFGRKYPEINMPKSFVVPTYMAGVNNEYSELMNIKYPVIARSSSTVEDSELSFAGLFDSYVCQSYEELLKAIRDIQNGIFAEQILEYCKRFNVDSKNIRMAVLIQEYLKPQISGVTFTKNPLNNDETVIYTEYCKKSSDAVTSGTIKTQNFLLNKNVSEKETEDFLEIKQISLRAEEFLKRAADIEWVVSDDKLFIVQIRPVTS